MTTRPLGSFGERVTWTTDVPSTSSVEYGTATSYGLLTPVDQALVTDHRVVLDNLKFFQGYHFRVVSTSGGGPTAVSSDSSFRTLPLPNTVNTTAAGRNREILLDGKPFFPLMQWLVCPSRFDRDIALGVNTFLGYEKCHDGQSKSAWLDTLRRKHALGIPGRYDAAVAGKPALAGWFYGDEPDLSAASAPSVIRPYYSSTRNADPSHAQWLNLTPGFEPLLPPLTPSWMTNPVLTYRQYAGVTDIIGFDFYPLVSWCKPAYINRNGDLQRYLVTTIAPLQPSFQFIEAANYNSPKCSAAPRVLDYQVRAEAWLAIINGAKAIAWWTHVFSPPAPSYSEFSVDPSVQTEIARTDRQITNFTAPLLSGQRLSNLSETVSRGGRVDYLARSYNGLTYLFAVNALSQPTTATFTNPAFSNTAITVFEEQRTLTPTASGAFTDTFTAYAVHIYIIGGGGR